MIYQSHFWVSMQKNWKQNPKEVFAHLVFIKALFRIANK